MELKIKTFCICLLLSLSSKAQLMGSNKLTWQVYYPALTDCKAKILLSIDENQSVCNPLNLYIFQQSIILNQSMSAYSEVIDSLDLKDLSTSDLFNKYFKLSGDSIYSENANLQGTDCFFEGDTLLCFGEILSYRTSYYLQADKGGATSEIINIKLSSLESLELKDVVEDVQIFKLFLSKYLLSHKAEVKENILDDLLSKSDQSALQYLNVLRNGRYNFSKLDLKSEQSKLLWLDRNGIAVQIDFVDNNYYNKFTKGDYLSLNNHSTYIFIPYSVVKPFFNTKGSIYDSLMELTR